MNENPVSELINRLREIWPEGVDADYASHYDARMDLSGGYNSNDLAFWHYLRDLQHLIDQVEASLSAAESNGVNVAVWRRVLPAVYRHVWQPSLNWEQVNYGGTGVSEDDMDKLGLLATILEAHGSTPITDTERLSQIVADLTDVKAIIDGIENDDLARHHLLWQVDQAIRFASHVDVFGGSTVVTAVQETLTEGAEYANAAESGIDDETRGRLRRAIGKATRTAFGWGAQGAVSQGGRQIFELLSSAL